MTLVARDELLLLLDSMGTQWFAAEEEGRTEDPTEHKIRKAREEGKVAKSPDVTSAIVLLFAVITFAVIGQGFLETMGQMLTYYLVLSTQVDPVTSGVVARGFYEYFFRLLWPVFAVVVIAAIIGNVFQVGFLFTTKPLVPDFKRIAPNFVKFFQRALFSTEALYNLFKSLGKIIIIGAVAYLNIQGRLPELMNAMKIGYMRGFGLVAEISFAMVIETTIILLVLSLVDYWFQRRQHLETLKMSKQEIKEERKNYEGDPMIKNRMRQRMREILSQNIMREVPKADVIITNPTHYAVALAYKAQAMTAPTVVAKGVDTLAQRIKQIAFENDVPVIENRPLARALYAEVELGDTIPEQYYEAVVTVFKEIYRMNKGRKEVG
ncbi:MAG: flagellar biosynthesis protein FlhB [Spirochaetales bacterium]|nr:flagellar biosynthesis protein FlhB [Spirochaetales bacterium]